LTVTGNKRKKKVHFITGMKKKRYGWPGPTTRPCGREGKVSGQVASVESVRGSEQTKMLQRHPKTSPLE